MKIWVKKDNMKNSIVMTYKDPNGEIYTVIYIPIKVDEWFELDLDAFKKDSGSEKDVNESVIDNGYETFCNWCNKSKDYIDLHHEGFCKDCWLKYNEIKKGD